MELACCTRDRDGGINWALEEVAVVPDLTAVTVVERYAGNVLTMHTEPVPRLATGTHPDWGRVVIVEVGARLAMIRKERWGSRMDDDGSVARTWTGAAVDLVGGTASRSADVMDPVVRIPHIAPDTADIGDRTGSLAHIHVVEGPRHRSRCAAVYLDPRMNRTLAWGLAYIHPSAFQARVASVHDDQAVAETGTNANSPLASSQTAVVAS